MIPLDTPVGTTVKLLYAWGSKYAADGTLLMYGEVAAGTLGTIVTEYDPNGYGYHPTRERGVSPGSDPSKDANGSFGVRLEAYDYKGNLTNHHFAHPEALALDIVTDEDVRAAFGRTFRFPEAEEATP